MEMTSPFAQSLARRPAAPISIAAAGVALLAVGFYAAVWVRRPLLSPL